MQYKAILDASALLALINAETGADAIARILPHAAMSSVNFSEVVTILHSKGMPLEEAHLIIGPMLPIIPFSKEYALSAAGLYLKTKHRGLSLGDRACLAVAQCLSVPVYTADRAWSELNLDIKIHLIR